MDYSNTANEGRFRLNVDSPYGERAQSMVLTRAPPRCPAQPRRDFIFNKEKAIEALLKETRSRLVDLKESKRQTEELLLEKVDSIALECKQKLATYVALVCNRVTVDEGTMCAFPNIRLFTKR